LKLNKEKLRTLAALDDASLWREIREAVQKFGYTLPTEVPSRSDMGKIRDAMQNAEKINALQIARMLSSLKAKKSKG
jgi:hypothetical protein